MRMSPLLTRPRCHLSYVSGPGVHAPQEKTAVWICEYPYRTMRLTGPSADCEDCPVWHEMELERMAARRPELEEVAKAG
jgi:hypothetical protein